MTFNGRQAGRQFQLQIQLQIQVEVQMQVQVQFEVERVHSGRGKEVRKVFFLEFKLFKFFFFFELI